MKKLVTICVALAIPLVLGSTALADMSFWMDPADLGNMIIVPKSNLGTITSITPQPQPYTYKYTGQTTLDPSDGISGKAIIGYQWWPVGAGGANSYNGKPFPDLSGYDDFRMSFHNQGSDPVLVNLWMTTGYTDSGTEQYGTWAENGWLEVEECTWTTLVLDFDNADMWHDTWPSGPWGQYEAGGTIPWLTHVTGIGFQIVTPLPVNFSVDVDTVPVPAAVLLGMLGLGAAGLKLRKFV